MPDEDEVIRLIAEKCCPRGVNSETQRLWLQEAAIWIMRIRASEFELINYDELERLRANQTPPGHVCIDPEAPIPGFASDAFDCTAHIHNEYGENLYVENTDEAIRAYLRALRDRQKGAGK